MTCPVSHQSTSVLPSVDRAARNPVLEQFERFSGSVFVALFAGALFDQTMLPEVSAALEDTGRFRKTEAFGRAIRSAASEQLAFAGDDTDRRAEMDRLKRLHRDVKGVGYNGVRYSALNPQSWNWIMISTFFMHLRGYEAMIGERLSDADHQAVWDRYREMVEQLQLPGRSRLVESYPELCAYYDRMVSEKLESNVTLENVVGLLRRPPRPDFLPRVTAPAWELAAPVAGHVAAVLGFGIMHPGVRSLTGMRWTARHDFEFAALTKVLGLTYRLLPSVVTDTPLVRNRRRYAKLVERYQAVGLSSFAPEKLSS
ncbi:oxygenase MpaB family protein [Nocardia altamirensis]|uniref:oxygenase MpaB family protein n=1 Tax=Nocardia altamirensis TaxID=472158 RepID=UPI00084004B2|nr:oxygenase MpaB family protein [Nocardia altamirensis]